ncbi:MAG: aromatic-ring-hydroxylating dioxygenase subunit beta [Candidatus Binatia bacterium]
MSVKLREMTFDAADLLHAYVHALDNGQYERWADFFTEDALYKIVARDNYERDLPLATMFCQGKGMMRDRVIAIREALVYSPNYLRHLVSAVRVTDANGGSFAVEANYVVFSTAYNNETKVFNSGKYLDEIVYVEGQAKFNRKLVVYDSLLIPSLLVIPL